MAIKVLITREFRKDKLNEAYKLLMKLRSMATLRKGYLSGETIISADNPNKLVVISTWVSQKRWEDWHGNEKRKNFVKKLEDEYLAAPEHVEVYLVGEKIPEWVDMA
ncbi:MAG: antibiotic biosynthesis monooxygenase [Desulfomonilaceae bacterium]|nr:antibiotic biosynthesis monooxygenase [Desulfomonilaceae bacterium]